MISFNIATPKQSWSARLAAVVCLLLTACGHASLEGTEAILSNNSRPAEPTTEQHLSPAAERRWNATAHVVHGLIMRVEAVAASLPGERLAGYLIHADSEQAASDEVLEQLIALVRNNDGFDDSIVKRCKSGLSVGFRLFRKDASTGNALSATELVLDFGCDRMTVAEEGQPTTLESYYFDLSLIGDKHI
jgi:hypothetical protein